MLLLLHLRLLLLALLLLLLQACKLVKLLFEQGGLHVLNAFGPLAFEQHLLQVRDGKLRHLAVGLVGLRLRRMGGLH